MRTNMKLATHSTFAFLASVAFTGALVMAGCGSDDTNVTPPPADGGDMDATTTVDAGDGSTGTTDGSPSTDGSASTDGASSDSGPACAVGVSCGGTCTDTKNDGKNCGGCGNVCAEGLFCSGGICQASCTGGTVSCNGGGSCADTSVDPNNCGACGTVCPTGLVCSGGTCATTCEAGQTICGTSSSSSSTTADAGDASTAPASRICVNTQTDDYNCGACGAACPTGQVCSGGSCAASCQAGLVLCNGLCIDPTTSTSFCGATAGCGTGDAGGSAGTACAGGQACNAGLCQTTCQQGLVNCNGSCIDPATNRGLCGASGNCTDVGAGNSTGTVCAPGTICAGNGTCANNCQADEIQCGTSCVNPLIDRTFCGASGTCAADGKAGDSAGTTCASGQVCSSGACVATCAAGQATCHGTCVDGTTNGKFCGAKGKCDNSDAADSSGTVCGAGTVCSGGTCVTSCQANEVLCGSTCVDPMTNGAFCGAVGDCTTGSNGGTVCAAGTVCTGGTCQASCAAGEVLCGGTCIDPTVNGTFCGAKGDCTTGTNAGTTCGAGTACVSGSCSADCGAGLAICGASCVDQQHDPNHCGTTCTACALPHVATDACRSGTCGVAVCSAGYGDCDGLAPNGCEDPIGTDANNCGACGHVCPTGSRCSAGACTSTLNVAIENGAYEAGDLYTFLSTQPGLVVSMTSACDATSLAAFDVVIVYGNMDCHSDAAFTSYVNAGGGLIGTPWIIANGYGLSALPVSGRGGAIQFNTPLNVTVTDATDVLLTGVTFGQGNAIGYESNTTLAPGATNSVKWADGSYAVAKESLGSGRSVYLDFHYITSDCQRAVAYTWGQTLMLNAIHWAAQ